MMRRDGIASGAILNGDVLVAQGCSLSAWYLLEKATLGQQFIHFYKLVSVTKSI